MTVMTIGTGNHNALVRMLRSIDSGGGDSLNSGPPATTTENLKKATYIVVWVCLIAKAYSITDKDHGTIAFLVYSI